MKMDVKKLLATILTVATLSTLSIGAGCYAENSTEASADNETEICQAENGTETNNTENIAPIGNSTISDKKVISKYNFCHTPQGWILCPFCKSKSRTESLFDCYAFSRWNPTGYSIAEYGFVTVCILKLFNLLPFSTYKKINKMNDIVASVHRKCARIENELSETQVKLLEKSVLCGKEEGDILSKLGKILSDIDIIHYKLKIGKYAPKE
ncbi:MAG: hypothetical protein IJ758_01000 [Clostridia bacterium]|nr:hypothetical protein [Clostridia bacterium]